MITNDPTLHALYQLICMPLPHSPDFVTQHLSPTHHLFLSLIPVTWPITRPITHPHHPFLYSTLSHLVMCYAHQSHMTHVPWAPPGSLQICWATAPTLQDKLSPWLSSPGLASSISQPYVPVKFMRQHILFCKLFHTCFIPHSLD